MQFLLSKETVNRYYISLHWPCAYDRESEKCQEMLRLIEAACKSTVFASEPFWDGLETLNDENGLGVSRLHVALEIDQIRDLMSELVHRGIDLRVSK